MQANNRTDAGCTVDAVPYKVLDLEASKLNFAGPDVKATPVMAVPLVLENAPVGVVPFVFPTGWNVPVMFGRRTSQDKSTYVGLGVASRTPALYRRAVLPERRLAEHRTA
jgi:hypothetical protein